MMRLRCLISGLLCLAIVGCGQASAAREKALAAEVAALADKLETTQANAAVARATADSVNDVRTLDVNTEELIQLLNSPSLGAYSFKAADYPAGRCWEGESAKRSTLIEIWGAGAQPTQITLNVVIAKDSKITDRAKAVDIVQRVAAVLMPMRDPKEFELYFIEVVRAGQTGGELSKTFGNVVAKGGMAREMGLTQIKFTRKND